MKPDWKDAPQWATYLAMDGDFVWHWFEEEPWASGEGLWLTRGFAPRVAEAGTTVWHHTLEQRP